MSGPKQVFRVGIASGASTSSALDLGDKAHKDYSITYVTMSTGAAVTVWGSDDGTTFRQVFERVNTAPVQHQAVTIGTAASGSWCQVPAFPFRYMQLTTSAVVSGGVSFLVACS